MRSLNVLIRTMALLLLVACGLAIGVARLVPRSAGFRIRQAPRHAAFNGGFFWPSEARTSVLDTKTGAVSVLAVPPAETLQWVAFSDWVDEQGESQLVGRWLSRSGEGGSAACEGVGVARYSFPSLRPLNRVRLDHTPVVAPCWYPQDSARIVFAAGDGRLYHYQFSESRGGTPEVIDDQAGPIRWPNLPQAALDVSIQDPVWPKDPRLGGRLIASVSFTHKRGRHGLMGPYRLWWLLLDADGTTVVEAGPLLAGEEPRDEGQAADPRDERFPLLRPDADGDLLLAYYLSGAVPHEGQVRYARVEFDPRTDVPVIRHSASRTLVDRCMPVSGAFTPAGDGLFVLVRASSGRATFARAAVAESMLPPPSGALARHGSARRSLSARRWPASPARNPG